MSFTNTAAYLVTEKARPLEIRPAPIVAPGENQILIRNHAIALNPIDHKIQDVAALPITYPAVLGQDVAGEVVQVGPGVTRFRPGDRVLGFAAGFATLQNADRAYQAYTILATNLTTRLPDGVPYDRASVVPVGVTTAAAGLFQPDLLNLRLPTVPSREPAGGETLVVWGGASSVGGSAVQLAVAAGYEVFATASPKNFGRVRELGASHVFDYNSATVIDDLVAVAKGKKIVGVFDAIGANEGVGPSVEFLRNIEGVKLVASALPVFLYTGSTEGVTVDHFTAHDLLSNPIGKAIFEDFLPEALKAGSYLIWPEPLVFGKGLESLQGAMDLLAKGVSAQKVVVVL